jgi:hypothetical protein
VLQIRPINFVAAGRKRCYEGFRREFLGQLSPKASSCRMGDGRGYIALGLASLKLVLLLLGRGDIDIVDQAALRCLDGLMIPSYSYLNLYL